MGVIIVAALATSAAAVPNAAMTITSTLNQVGCQRWQPIIIALSPAVFDRHVSALNVADLAQTAINAVTSARRASGDVPWRNPTTGIAGCCARAAYGHAAAVPPSSVMNSRRLMRGGSG